MKHLDGISDDEISRVSLPNGLPLLYNLDSSLTPIPPKSRALDACGRPSPLNAEFLGDPAELSSRLIRDAAVIGLECRLDLARAAGAEAEEPQAAAGEIGEQFVTGPEETCQACAPSLPTGGNALAMAKMHAE